jgi:hypothetical protein
LKILFADYVLCVSTEIDQILSDVVTTHGALEEIKKKLQNIDGVNNKDDQNPANNERQQRAIKIVEEFIDDNRVLLNNIELIISKITEYKNEINQLSQTKVPSGPLNVSLEYYIEQIENARTHLSKTKEAFDGKMESAKQQQKIEL